MVIHHNINQVFVVFVVLLVYALAGLVTHASAETLLSKHGDWEAFTERDREKLVCYMGAIPTKSLGKYTKRGLTYILITHRPAEKSRNVVSVQAGYTFKKASEVELIIDRSSFKLFTDEQWAFAADATTDNELVKSMIRGAKLIVRGVSSRGTQTTDTYSLKGFTAAYKAIGKACKI